MQPSISSLRWNEQAVEDYLIDNSALSIDQTAREVLRVTGWLDG